MYLSCPESMESMDRRTASGKHTIETIEKWRNRGFCHEQNAGFSIVKRGVALVYQRVNLKVFW